MFKWNKNLTYFNFKLNGSAGATKNFKNTITRYLVWSKAHNKDLILNIVGLNHRLERIIGMV